MIVGCGLLQAGCRGRPAAPDEVSNSAPAEEVKPAPGVKPAPVAPPAPEPATAVRPADLGRLIDRADRLVVLKGPRDGAMVLFESDQRRDLDALKAAVAVKEPVEWLRCKCDGTTAVALYAGKERIGRITNHHAKLVRCSLWTSDAPLASAEAFLAWFDERGIAEPRAEHDEARARAMAWDDSRRKWRQAMPPALRPHGEEIFRAFPGRDIGPLRKTLAQKMPNQPERIRALFAWYGSGQGPWSGYPSYEELAEQLLLDYPTKDLLAAIKGRQLTGTQTEGVARLFGGWTFSQLRGQDLALLPAELKSRLLKHSMASPDEDKRRRAQKAFN
jgi:hypothetical protein